MNDRDEFAAAALSAVIALPNSNLTADQAADVAYQYANAMMKRRFLGEPDAVTQLPSNEIPPTQVVTS